MAEDRPAGRGWAVEVPALPAVVTHARTLCAVEPADAERAQAAASAAMRRAVAALAQIGLTNRDAGRLLEVSHQRVAQIAASGVQAAEGRRGRRTRHASP